MTSTGLLPSGLSCVPKAEETLARALFSDNQFNASGPKFSAFMPSGTGKTSVFRKCDHDAVLLRSACDAAASGHGKPAKRVAITTVAHVLAETLSVVPSEPPSRHADIVDWPSNSDPERQKADRKLVAMKIAESARLVLPA